MVIWVTGFCAAVPVPGGSKNVEVNPRSTVDSAASAGSAAKPRIPLPPFANSSHLQAAYVREFFALIGGKRHYRRNVTFSADRYSQMRKDER